MTTENTKEITEARRRFLQQCGKFSIATPPAVALLLATANRSYATVRSGGPHVQGGNDQDRGDRGGGRDNRGGKDR
jgi:hypothetical protein